MSKKVDIRHKEEIFSKYFFAIEEAQLQHELPDGQMSAPMHRINFKRGDSVAVLMHDPEADSVLLADQFRYPTYSGAGTGWLVEIPAGSMEPGETPAETARREVIEETGYQLLNLKPISTFYLSPGGSSERIFLYYAVVQPRDKIAAGGGKAGEGEHVQILHMKVLDLLEAIENGKIMDAKTIIAAQWLELNRMIEETTP